jgi:hypothetical protein
MKKEERKVENLKLYKIKAKFKKEKMKNSFNIFHSNTKLFIEYRTNNNLSYLYLKKKSFIKIIDCLKKNKLMKRKKRNLLLKSKRFNEKNVKKKIIEKWKFYIMYQKNKRNEYLYAKNKRNEIIAKHFIQNLINISSENPNINNINNLNNNNIIIEDKNSFNNFDNSLLNGNQTFFNNNELSNNKNDYFINDDISFRNNLNNINNNINSNNNYINNNNNNINIINNNKNRNENIFSDLKGIRNKQRSKPVILDLNSL